jgi:hypothetical protein
MSYLEAVSRKSCGTHFSALLLRKPHSTQQLSVWRADAVGTVDVLNITYFGLQHCGVHLQCEEACWKKELKLSLIS